MRITGVRHTAEQTEVSYLHGEDEKIQELRRTIKNFKLGRAKESGYIQMCGTKMVSKKIVFKGV